MGFGELGNKGRYAEFCGSTYVPIFSQPWWMDAVCGADGWDVWLCERGDEVVAAMPYYRTARSASNRITKAPLTQNNGIVFRHLDNSNELSRQKAEEKIIDEACGFVASLGLSVYEQQYHYSFTNWLPFSWNGYAALPRYTFVIEDTSDLDVVEARVSRGHRKNIRKGSRNASVAWDLDPGEFYREHEKIFAKQGLPCPFSEDLWLRLYAACRENDAGRILYAVTPEGRLASLMFLVWDAHSAYPLLGGSMPELQSLETYSMLTWESIKCAHEKSLSYDFEGSMIKRIAKSFREYGGEPKLYFRIRKVFDPAVVRAEAESQIERLGTDAVQGS